MNNNLSPEIYDPFLGFIASAHLSAIAFGVLAIVLLDAFKLLKREFISTMLAVITLFASFVFIQPQQILNSLFLSRQVSADSFGAFVSIIIVLSSIFIVVLNHGSLKAQGVERGADFKVLLLLSVTGALGLVCSNDLISLFLSLEVMSVPLYVLVASARKEKSSTEGALKYFLLGAIGSAFFLYGIALVYAVSGTVDIQRLAVSSLETGPILLVAMGLMLFGFAFKLSLAPFHFWSPDAYQGAPLSILGFMSVVVKSAVFGAIIRVMGLGFGSVVENWSGFIILLGCLSMFVGNFVALRQRSIKRLFAYSSIAHTGYAIVALPFLGGGGLTALLVYLVSYVVTTLGIVAVLIGHLGGTEGQYDKDDISRLKGLYDRDPVAAMFFAIFVMSLAGIPPLAGFYGKFFIVSTLMKAEFFGVAIFLVLNSVVSLSYYLGLFAVIFEKGEDVKREEFGLLPSRSVLLLSGLAVVLATIFVDPVFYSASTAAETLLSFRQN